MRKLTSFNHTSLDGFFTDVNGDMSFAHNPIPDPEWDAFGVSNASGGGMLLFGRITYELMAAFWPTPSATAAMPALADRMNNLPKIVFSRTLDRALWNNTKLVKGDLIEGIRRMKEEPGEDMAILGSGSLVSQLTPHGLIDEYQIVVNPVVLGAGRTLFEGVGQRVPLSLVKTRTFSNGNVLMCYGPKH